MYSSLRCGITLFFSAVLKCCSPHWLRVMQTGHKTRLGLKSQLDWHKSLQCHVPVPGKIVLGDVVWVGHGAFVPGWHVPGCWWGRVERG